MYDASLPYSFASCRIAASREQSAPVAPGGQGSSTGAGKSYVSSGVSFAPAGASCSTTRVRSGFAGRIRL